MSDPQREFPDAYYTARKINGLCRYVETNRTVRIHQVSLTVIHNLLLTSLKNNPSFMEEEIFKTDDPSCFCCFSVFQHIYLLCYREQDFASLDNFHRCFIHFQRLLWEISTAYYRHGKWIHEKLPQFKLFDVKNLPVNVAHLKRWNCEWQKNMDVNNVKCNIETRHKLLIDGGNK